MVALVDVAVVVVAVAVTIVLVGEVTVNDVADVADSELVLPAEVMLVVEDVVEETWVPVDVVTYWVDVDVSVPDVPVVPVDTVAVVVDGQLLQVTAQSARSSTD